MYDILLEIFYREDIRMKNGKSQQELKNELYSGYFVCVIFLCGVILRNRIPWEWLRVGIICGFIMVLLELIPLQYKFLKLKKLHPTKDEVQ